MRRHKFTYYEMPPAAAKMLVDRVGQRFFDETDLGAVATFSPEVLTDVMETHTAGGTMVTYLAFDGPTLVGFCSYTLQYAYTVEPMANLFLTYVLPEYRRSEAGRRMLELVIASANEHGACTLYAGSLGEVKAQVKSFTNLLARTGFEDTGTMSRMRMR